MGTCYIQPLCLLRDKNKNDLRSLNWVRSTAEKGYEKICTGDKYQE